MSALRFSWALIEQRKRNKPPLRNRLGSLAPVGLVLARSLCSVLMAALHLARSNAVLGRLRRGQNVPLYCSQRPVYSYISQTPSKTHHYTIPRGQKSETSEFAHGSLGPAQIITLLTMLFAALCTMGAA